MLSLSRSATSKNVNRCPKDDRELVPVESFRGLLDGVARIRAAVTEGARERTYCEADTLDNRPQCAFIYERSPKCEYIRMRSDHEPSPFFPEEQDSNKEKGLELLRSRLREAEQQIRGTSIAQAHWQVRAVFEDTSASSLLSPEAKRALEDAENTLEHSIEIQALRAIRRVRDEVDPRR